MKSFKQYILEGKVTDNPNFIKWFGNSKAVDKSGNPLVLYHGSRTTRAGKRAFSSLQGFFTTNPDIANDYAQGNHVYPVFVRIENPVPEMYLKSENDPENAYYNKEFVQWAMKKGYDGYIYKDLGSTSGYLEGTNYVPFSATQIKSATGNNGNFDPNDPDITH